MQKTAVLLLLVATIGCGLEKSQRSATPPAEATHAAPTETTGAADVGSVMPAYSAKYLDGKPFDLASEKGTVVFLNVWATWCGPCRYEIPELQALQEKYAGRGFEVIGVNVDEAGADAVSQFVKENKITYPIALDPEGRIANVLRTTVLPTSLIIGRDGRIVWREVGAMTPNETSAVDSVLRQALAKKS